MPPFNIVSRKSTPEIVLSSKNYRKVKMKGGIGWMTKYRGSAVQNICSNNAI